MREENFVAGDGKFVLAKFLVREQFGQCHAAKVTVNCPLRKAELKSFQNIGKVAVWTIDAVPELDDFVSDHQRDQHINEPRHPSREGVQLARAVLVVDPADLAERIIQFAADLAAGVKVGKGPARKAELKSFQNIGKVTMRTVEASPELDDFVSDHQRDQHINESRHPSREGV